MSVANKLLQAAAGSAGADATYVEDVFSTYLYEGTGTSFSGPGQTITNGIDLNGEGGMVWLKTRDSSQHNLVMDTERGGEDRLITNSTGAAGTDTGYHISSFNSDGFSLQANGTGSNNSSYDYVSWTFRNQPGFFEVHTYTGTGGSQDINHTLGCKPGAVIVKRTDASSDWGIYTRNGNSDSESGIGYLNKTDAFTTGALSFTVTDSLVRIFSNSFSFDATTSGGEFVVYLFAMGGTDTAANVFGKNSNQPIIKCGTYTASTGNNVDVGFEPQWILTKSTSSSSSDWYLFDTMRDWHTDQGSSDAYLSPNITSGDGSTTNSLGLHSNGFTAFNGGGQTYWYMAIRRPNKVASELTATDMFAPILGTSSSDWIFDAGFPVDLHFYSKTSNNRFVFDRMRGDKYLTFNSATAETAFTCDFDYMNYCDVASSTINGWMTYNFKRTPEFFDIVTYVGNASNRTINHNLEVAPEMMIIKCRGNTNGWVVYHTSLGPNYGAILQSNSTPIYAGTFFNSTNPTSSVISIGSAGGTNENGQNIIAYLFASSPGISKVGSYTGTGSDVNVDCGFTSGARFVLVKRTDSAGDWYLWDSERGIVAGNDPYFFVNSTSYSTSTDYIDPLSSGFTITSSAPATLNASGGTYIFYAIA